MKSRSTVFAIMGLVIAGVVLAVSVSFGGAAPEGKNTNDDELGGAILMVYSTDLRTPAILKNASIKDTYGRKILVGTCVETSRDDDWRVGLEYRMPWEDVKYYFAITEADFEKIKKDYGNQN